MALFKFTQAILNNRPIDVYNFGDMKRDFTYIDDLTSAMRLLVDAIPSPLDYETGSIDSLSRVAPFRVVNIGNSNAIKLTDFIEAIETALGKTAQKNMMPMQAGDVPATWASTELLSNLTGYAPATNFQLGITNFVNWYCDYYKI
jgi:UDP-glucuronate 4-epimerase